MCRNNSEYGLSQWQQALPSNAFSYWPSPYPERSLRWLGVAGGNQLSWGWREEMVSWWIVITLSRAMWIINTDGTGSYTHIDVLDPVCAECIIADIEWNIFVDCIIPRHWNKTGSVGAGYWLSGGGVLPDISRDIYHPSYLSWYT